MPCWPVASHPRLLPRACRPPPPAAAGQWVTQLGLSLPAASSFFVNYAIIHGLCINFFRFVW